MVCAHTQAACISGVQKRHFGSHASSDNKGQDVHDNPFASFRELCM